MDGRAEESVPTEVESQLPQIDTSRTEETDTSAEPGQVSEVDKGTSESGPQASDNGHVSPVIERPSSATRQSQPAQDRPSSATGSRPGSARQEEGNQPERPSSAARQSQHTQDQPSSATGSRPGSARREEGNQPERPSSAAGQSQPAQDQPSSATGSRPGSARREEGSRPSSGHKDQSSRPSSAQRIIENQVDSGSRPSSARKEKPSSRPSSARSAVEGSQPSLDQKEPAGSRPSSAQKQPVESRPSSARKSPRDSRPSSARKEENQAQVDEKDTGGGSRPASARKEGTGSRPSSAQRGSLSGSRPSSARKESEQAEHVAERPPSASSRRSPTAMSGTTAEPITEKKAEGEEAVVAAAAAEQGEGKQEEGQDMEGESQKKDIAERQPEEADATTTTTNEGQPSESATEQTEMTSTTKAETDNNKSLEDTTKGDEGQEKDNTSQGSGEASAEDAPKKKVKKPVKRLSVLEVQEKATLLMEEVAGFTSYDNKETTDVLKAIGRLYWDQKPHRHVTAEILQQHDFAGLSIKMLLAFNKIGIFKSDDVWFPAYYTLNNTWNYTDASRALGKEFSDKGMIPLMLANITHKPYLENLSSKNVGYVLKASLSILQNLSQVPETKQVFLDNNAIEALKPFTSSENQFFKAVAMMTLTSIISEADNAVLEDTGSIPFMVKGIGFCTQAKNRRYRGFAPAELTDCLGRMAVNDSNKMKIVAEGALPLFVEMLEAKDPEENAAAAQTLWTLSFDDEVRKKILEEPGCVSNLEKLVSSEHQATRKAAKGALWKLRGEEQHEQQLEKKGSEEKDEGEMKDHIMISYNWSHQKLIIQIADRLKAEGFRVWLDVDQMGGSTLEAMASAVENAAVVIIAMSEKYKLSPNCRTEGEYTFQRRKPIVPILVQPKYRADGWLGMLLGAKLFIDFSGKHPFDKAFNMMLREISGRGHPNYVAPAPVEPQTAQLTSSAPAMRPVSGQVRPFSGRASEQLKAWSREQVSQWLTEHGLDGCRDAFSEVDGRLLAGFITVRAEAPEYFYSMLERKFALGTLDIFRFVNAMSYLP